MKIKLTVEDGDLRYDLKRLLRETYKGHAHRVTLNFFVNSRGDYTCVEHLRVISVPLKREAHHVKK